MKRTNPKKITTPTYTHRIENKKKATAAEASLKLYTGQKEKQAKNDSQRKKRKQKQVFGSRRVNNNNNPFDF